MVRHLQVARNRPSTSVVRDTPANRTAAKRLFDAGLTAELHWDGILNSHNTTQSIDELPPLWIAYCNYAPRSHPSCEGICSP